MESAHGEREGIDSDYIKSVLQYVAPWCPYTEYVGEA